ncbi:hypothetical protein CKN86_04850 [Carnobacterium divergens]|nr:hypothetical protein CKN62_04885 [Carnobacterium divergens]TFI90440.1 hypothetical protein CKN84_04885 [Carnobacterium divergens]TFJ05161.1 hypothetical protein CKN86_04850 [Carnobacterium divergens]TFJ06783.1 hypothetical protein CKN65_04890 [Carnobacterium divergens]
MGAGNMKKWLGFLLIGLVLIGLLSMLMVRWNQKNEAELVTIKNEAFLDVVNTKKSGIFYIGRPTCVHCQAFQPKLEAALKSTNKQVFYYNTDEAKKEDNALFSKIIKTTSISSVPMVIVIKDGAVVKKLTNYKDQTKIENFLNKEAKLY